MDIPDAIAAYEAERPLYEAMAGRIKMLLQDLLSAGKIDFHVIESRAKTTVSFSEKMNRSGKNYIDPLQEMTDLCAGRIILYYIDDVEKVSDLIKKEFSIVEEVRDYQSDQLDADRFGYLSLHMIVKNKQNKGVSWGMEGVFRQEI